MTADRQSAETALSAKLRHRADGGVERVEVQPSLLRAAADALDVEWHSMVAHADCADDCEVRTAGEVLDTTLASDAARRREESVR